MMPDSLTVTVVYESCYFYVVSFIIQENHKKPEVLNICYLGIFPVKFKKVREDKLSAVNIFFYYLHTSKLNGYCQRHPFQLHTNTVRV